MTAAAPARWQIQTHADPGEVFAPGAFDSQIGKQIPVTLTEQGSLLGTLIAAEISDQGRTATLTVETLTPVTPAGGLDAWNIAPALLLSPASPIETGH
ncbi:hypothetical protein [Nonomuraea glycinis]|uniref:hypothetical protein n=1 Tax=Nonomuraea glycinis TaxID=2047744 RepID=UPI0033A62570